MITLVVTLALLFTSFYILVIVGLAAENKYIMTGHYPYKYNLYPIASLIGFVFLIVVALTLSHTNTV